MNRWIMERRAEAVGVAVGLMMVAIASAALGQTVPRRPVGPTAPPPAPVAAGNTNPYYANNENAGELVPTNGPTVSEAETCLAGNASACRAIDGVITPIGWTDCGSQSCLSSGQRAILLRRCDNRDAEACATFFWLSRKGYDSWKAHSDMSH